MRTAWRFALTLGLVAAGALAQVENGVQVGPELPTGSGPTGQEPQGGFINFDDAPQPCVFAETVALTTEYAAQGVVFSGPGGNDGGAVLDECSNFGVTGYSPPNFLAFNTSAILSDGGVARGPETMTFTPPATTVSILAGHDAAGLITMDCEDSGGTSVGTDSLNGASALATLSVAAAEIAACVLSFPGPLAVFDDLTFVPVPVELQSFDVE